MAGILGKKGGKEEKKEIKAPRHYIRIAREIKALEDRYGSRDDLSDEQYDWYIKRLEELRAEYEDSMDFYHNPERMKEYRDSLPWWKKIFK